MTLKKDNFVLSLGGSLIAPKEGIDAGFLRQFRNLIARHVRRGRRFMIVCGGGSTARAYQRAASLAAGLSRRELDLIGIQATIINANLMRGVFGRLALQKIITDPRVPMSRSTPVIIGAGWQPGCSTDYDAVLLAKKFGARTVVNLSNIAYVYDKDPHRFASAKPLKHISWKDYRRQFGGRWRPGLNSPFDPVASRSAAKMGMRVIIADGRDLANIDRLLGGKPFKGTVIG
jgi:uridylate kinase